MLILMPPVMLILMPPVMLILMPLVMLSKHHRARERARTGTLIVARAPMHECSRPG